MWSANFAGQPARSAASYQEDIDVLSQLEPDQGAPVVQPPAPARSIFEDFPTPKEPTFDVTAESWEEMSSPQQRIFIEEEAVKRNSETVEMNGRQRRKWDTLTPKQRNSELNKVRNELGRQLRIDI